MRHKTFEVEVKAAGDAGEFVALASVFGNVDLAGDRMLPGAFTKTLERWRESGDPIPVVLSHQWDDPMAYVGKADPHEVQETAEGLQVKGRIDSSNPIGKQVYSLMKDRLLKGWSFGYTVPEDGEEFKDGVNNVSEVDLIEVGPTLKGANPEAQLQAIKSLEQEAAPALTDAEWQLVKDLREGKATISLSAPERTQPPEGEGDEEPMSGLPQSGPAKTPDPLSDELTRVHLELAKPTEE